MTALYDLYNSTNGPNWAWYYNTEKYGIRWNFSATANPCVDRWQGLNCSTNSSDYHITHIHLTAYDMKGTLPASIGLLSELSTISVDFNGLQGSLPATIGNLTKLRILNINSNLIGGTIPQSLYCLRNLSSLDLGINQIHGHISPSIGNMSTLFSLSMHVNYLSGQIPSTLGQLTNLRYVNLGSNYLSGPIPGSLGQLTQLTQLLLYVNALTGTVPVELSYLPVVHDMDLGSNLLHGTIPIAFGNLTSLRQLFFDSNELEGTIPTSLGGLVRLRYFYLRYNGFTGTIPNTFGYMHEMIELIFFQNQLTGTIPENFGNMVNLQYFDVGDNHLHGAVPGAFSNKTYLQYLHLDENMLTGTLSPELGSLPTLIELVLNSNHMYGSIPTALAQLSTLELLLIQYNHFTGSIVGVFNATSQGMLSTVKINNNQLSGELNTQVLLLPRLRILVAGTNCFTGSLPQELCTASRLETLSLDGLSSASTCRDPILPGISKSYLIPNSFSATVPACLFQLQRLVTLHLSGIGLSGGLPGAIPIGAALVDLGLSHNKLTGPIPHTFQQKLWFALDLSYNRLSGTLKSDFASGRFTPTNHSIIGTNLSAYTNDVSVSLENNRLSGRIPSRVQHLQNISILGSNLFSCNLQASDLPEHDAGKNDYLCGSTSFDVPYYVWVVSLGVFVGAFLVAYYCRVSLGRYLTIEHVFSDLLMWYTVLTTQCGSPQSNLKGRLHAVKIVWRICDLLCETSVVCTVYILVFLLPSFAALSAYNGTMTHQYTYTVSAAFLSGSTPSVVELVLFSGLLLLLVVVFVRHLSKYSKVEHDTHLARNASWNSSLANVQQLSPAAQWGWNALIYTLFASVNLFVVVGVNVAYVVVVIYRSDKFLVIAQILLALFKLMWNGVGSTYLVRWTTRNFLRSDQEDAKRISSEAQFIMLQVFLALVNNIAVPCIVAAVVSPSCFSDLFAAAPTVSTPYSYQICLNLIHGECIKTETIQTTTTYKPSFNYSYQCSSSIITYYAPAFVTLCIITTFVTPVLQVLIQQLHKNSQPGSLWRKMLRRVLPRILRPLSGDPEDVQNVLKYGATKPYFHVNRLLILLITYLGLLLTFGVVFPPLAAAFTVTLLAVVGYSKLKVGRFLCKAIELNRMEYVDMVEAECQRAGAVRVLRRSAWLLIAFSACFYTLFIFDTLGDEYGFENAYWVIIMVPLLPVAMFVAFNAAMRTLLYFGLVEAPRRPGSATKADGGDIELEDGVNFKSEAAPPANTTETFNVLH